MSARTHVARRLMADWQERQGKRASLGNHQILRALEFTARLVADHEASKPDPQPVVLTRGQVRTAWHRAISQQRRLEHGQPPADPIAWWEQISAIAQRWGVETTRTDWESTTPERKEAEAA